MKTITILLVIVWAALTALFFINKDYATIVIIGLAIEGITLMTIAIITFKKETQQNEPRST